MDSKSRDLDTIDIDAAFCVPVYGRKPITLVRGKGCYVWDSNGERYLDWVAGIAVDILGHSHKKWVEAVRAQAEKLAHVSNIYHNEHQPLLARDLVRVTGMEKAFFTNSGTESNEAAFKIARKWGKEVRGDHCFRVVSFSGSFHGRTFGGLSATAQEKYQKPFRPLVPGFVHVPFGDGAALDRELDDTVCAVIVEPIQGEGGLRPFSSSALQRIRRLCDERKILLILDEIQTGMGRTGKWLSCQHSNVLPDILTLAKGLGGGFPVGACLTRGRPSEILVTGEHGSTFGGNPLAMAVSRTVLNVLDEEGLIPNALEQGELLRRLFLGIGQRTGLIIDVRGQGLMLGVELSRPIARKVVDTAIPLGLLTNAVTDSTLRIVPPLILNADQSELGTTILERAIVTAAAA